ncbi:hypothetical protein V2S66_31365 [Streptomyces sp. V4-01]|uniref:Integral membrane protein n=1 Tax=Actinacidiphila polyblastidii TaxID=3110430 RepID=A0ABU7PKU1_9ACTN|nr:hypothetical protein [Streptomyces sp. V4-01]
MVAAAARRLRHDRRGLYLAIAGIGWCLFGVQLVLDPRPGTIRAAAILAHIQPLHAWGWVWITCGAVAVLAAVRQCPATRTWGFAAAEFPPLIWALGYTAAWLTGEYPQSWAGAATWACSAFRLMVVAGWADRIRADRGEGAGG